MSEWLKVHAWKACVRQQRTGGSNPPLSAKLMKVVKRSDFFPVFLFYRVRADSVDEGSIGKLGDSVSKSV